MARRTLYTGVGGNWSPHAPLLDGALCRAIRARGLVGRRTGPRSQHASPSYAQALQYAKNHSADHVFQLVPQQGNRLTWAPGVADLLLGFERFAKDLFWDGHRCPVLRDAQGDISTLEEYLQRTPRHAAVHRLASAYIRTVVCKEHLCSGQDDLDDVLEGHTGEVWVTGICPRVPCSDHLAPFLVDGLPTGANKPT